MKFLPCHWKTSNHACTMYANSGTREIRGTLVLKAPNAVFSNDENQLCGSTHLQQISNMATSVILYCRFKAPLATCPSWGCNNPNRRGCMTPHRLPCNSFQDAYMRTLSPQLTNTSFLTTHSILCTSFHASCICLQVINSNSIPN
jgi:hypothetical protein